MTHPQVTDAATIKLYLPNGDPKRLRTAEISNWNGKAVAAPRFDFEQFLAREELGGSGVYLLTGTDAASGKLTAYVGEAEILKERLKSHKAKDFWNHVTVFVSKDENLTKSHILYLEGRLLEEAKAAGRFLLDNAQSSGAKLPEADRADMEVFLSKVRQLLPVLGSDLLVPIAGQSDRSGATTFTLTSKDLTAKGCPTPTGFTVFKGSQAVLEHRPAAPKHTPGVVALREQLRGDSILNKGVDHFVFAEDYEFSSPSAAAAVICGGAMNGLTAWKNEQGMSLKELES